MLSGGDGAAAAGAAGTIMPDGGYTDLSFPFSLPTACFDDNSTTDIHDYINSTRYFSTLYIYSHIHK